MTHDQLEQVYAEHTTNELDQINETFADILIVKFDELLKNYNFVKPDSRLAQKLQDRKLFKNDVKTVVAWFTPLLPFLGVIEGGAVIVSEVMDNNKYENNNNDDTSCSTSQGHQQNSPTTESSQHDVDEDS